MKSDMYTKYAKDYADAINDNAFNAHFERPSTLSMLASDLTNKKILDLGCGSGVYAQYFLEKGAQLTAIDFHQEMINILKQNCGDEVNAYVQDLSIGLPKEQDASYDLVIAPLMIHYIEDLNKLFKDIKRVLKDSGEFIFSTHHPMVDFTASPSKNYFKKELIKEEWDTIGQSVNVCFYRRPLTELFSAIKNSGLCILEINEGILTEELSLKFPKIHERLSKYPNFLFIKCAIFKNKTL
jgi:SAM-dependent methyltransferase